MSMARFLPYSLMHVLDYILKRISSLYRFNNYQLIEKTYTIMLYIAGLSLRDISERYYISRRNIVERFFRYIKQKTKRFYSNINS